ncbi:hypothetical protein BH24PSE2_BH24PSE2_02680 [soil metagenome]
MQQAAEEAIEFMARFAERTGLEPEGPQQRYLWTDAFAVCNYLALADATGDERFTALALHLIDQVHHVLGRHREDDARSGWISGLSEREGEAHPTRGGLRIGKPLPERSPAESYDEQREWERDGQYFHYLTKWMHALDQASRATGQARFNLWARELAEAAHSGFSFQVPGSSRRMVWKMSIDLSRALVPSMGHHDPLDGFVTCLELQATAQMFGTPSSGPDLDQAVYDFAGMTAERDWSTDDPLGLGGLLADAARVAQLARQASFADSHLLNSLLDAAARGISQWSQRDELQHSASQRLAFRELGLAIGLAAVPLIESTLQPAPDAGARHAVARSALGTLEPYVSVGAEIRNFWLATINRQVATWSEHCDINEVMLATSLVPEGFLELTSPALHTASHG